MYIGTYLHLALFFLFQIFTLVVIFGLFHGLVFLPVMLSLLPQGTSGKISSSQPKSIKKDVQHNLGFDTKTSTLSIATVGTSGTLEQESPRAPSDFQNITQNTPSNHLNGFMPCPFTGPKMFCASKKTHFTECKSSFGPTQKIWTGTKQLLWQKSVPASLHFIF